MAAMDNGNAVCVLKKNRMESYPSQGCILSPCLFKFYAEYIMRNAGLGEAQAGIKIAGRNISNLRFADDITLWQKVERN